MRRYTFGVAVLTLTLGGLAVAASVEFRGVSINPAALAEMPELANFRCVDLVLILSEGESFEEVGLQLTLPVGNFFNHPLGSDGPPSPAVIPIFPAVAFDTHVSDGRARAAAITGRFSNVPGLALVGVANEFDARWRPIASPVIGPGDFPVARLTFPAENLGTTAIGEFRTSASPTPVSFQLTLIPEPAAASSALALCMVLIARARRGVRRRIS